MIQEEKPAKQPTITEKQQALIDTHDGDSAKTAKRIGVSYTYVRTLLKKPHIIKALRERNLHGSSKRGIAILTREERQAFWTSVIIGEESHPAIVGKDEQGNDIIENIPPKMADRLKASELLGRSEADFTDKIEKTHKISGSIMSLVADMVNKARQLPGPEQTAEGIKKAITVKPESSKIIGL